jgi:hypothetical protein
MLISGFTVIRNARIMGYPVVESIRSILPIVDEYVVGVGASDDDTRAIIESIDDRKIRIFDSRWDKPRAGGGSILAEKTNEALAQCRGDWCFYLQADEVVHERDLPSIKQSCEQYAADARVEGLLFKYVHFYGSYAVVGTARNWYRQEVRIVKRSAGAQSVGDAQSFLIDGRKAGVKWSGGTIYHYGHVNPPRTMDEKVRQMSRWYRLGEPDRAAGNYQFRHSFGLRTFAGTHPAVMQALVAAQDWQFEPRFSVRDWGRKDYKALLSAAAEAVFRYRFGERKKFKLLK